MSGLENAEFVISLDTSQLVAGSQKAKQAFQQMSDSGVQSMQTIQINADKVVTSNNKVADSVKQASDTMKASLSSAIAPMTGLAASSASLYFSFDQLERASIRVEQAHLRVSKAQEAVTKLQQEGKTDTLDYAQAMQTLQIQQERYDVSQNQVNENMVFMSLSMVTMATSTIPGVIKAVQALKISQEELGVALEATMPWLLAITGAVLAWEYAITPLVKSQTGLDLGIQSNIQKLIQQHTQLTTNINDFSEMPGVMGTADGALSTTTGAFDTLGSSVDSVSSKIKTFKDQVDASLNSFNNMKTLQNGSPIGQIPGMPNTGLTLSLSPSSDLLNSENDLFEKIKSITGSVADQRLEFNSLGGSIKKVGTQIQIAYGDEGLQQFINKIQELGKGGKDQIDELADSFQKLNNTIKSTSSSLDSIQKKADEITTNAYGISDTVFNQITLELSKQTGLTQAQVAESFSHNIGSAYNSKLDELYQLGRRDFGQYGFINTDLGQSMSRRNPFYDSVGNSVSDMGVNTSSLVGGLKNDDIHNMLVTLVADTHFFGENYGRDKDLLRQAVDNGEAQQQAVFEQNNPQWQMFYALRGAGLFTGDPNLSLEENLDNAEKAYNAIFTGLRPDVASALRAANEQTYSYRLYADARSPGIAVTRYTFEIPTQEALNRAIADSQFTSEIDFQNKLVEAQTKLGLSEKDIIDALSNALTNTDIQAELDFQSRLSAMSSGTV
ncbi:MAG TPA: hypothetical protein VFA69_05780 [Candidatus Nitrosotalea sp.]|nr:hypothetical protein [Candidatus Nitrosotalea sp.]